MKKIENINDKEEVVNFLGSSEHWLFRACIYNYLVDHAIELGINNVEYKIRNKGMKKYCIKADLDSHKLISEYEGIRKVSKILKDDLGAAAADTRWIMDRFVTIDKEIVPEYVKKGVVEPLHKFGYFAIVKDILNYKYMFVESKDDEKLVGKDVIELLTNVSEYDVQIKVYTINGNKGFFDKRVGQVTMICWSEDERGKIDVKNGWTGNDEEDWLAFQAGLI